LKISEKLDRLFADLDESGDLVDLDARQTEALRKASDKRRAARKEHNGGR
jgi:hypothetical protein